MVLAPRRFRGYVCTMYVMRFTLRTLMRDKGIKTAYALSKATGSAIPISTAARLIDPINPPTRIDFRTLDALCKALDVGPGDLLERDDKPAPAPLGKPAVEKPRRQRRTA